MTHNKLFTIVKDENDPEGQTVTVEPTEYLTKLKPREVIDVLRVYVKSLAEDVEQCSQEDLEMPENLEKLEKLVFELDVAQGYLAQVFERWKATQCKDSTEGKKPEPKETADLNELIVSQVFQGEALVNLLERKGIITRQELLEEVKRLGTERAKSETK